MREPETVRDALIFVTRPALAVLGSLIIGVTLWGDGL